jgi:hypothetical protein
MPDRDGDPTEGMANLLDLFILIGVGLMIFAMTSFGMGDFLSSGNATVVTNPGKTNMKITQKTNGQITQFQPNGKTSTGNGTAVGTVYQLVNGSLVWVPISGTSPATTPTP